MDVILRCSSRTRCVPSHDSKLLPSLTIGSIVGRNPSALGSRLLPNEVFECETGRSELTNLMMTSPSLNVLLTTPSSFNASANDSSITPA